MIPALGRASGEGIGYPLQYAWASQVAQLVKNPPAMRETWVPSLGWEDPLEKGKATHSSILAWRIPGTVHGVAKSRTRLSTLHVPVACLQPLPLALERQPGCHLSFSQWDPEQRSQPSGFWPCPVKVKVTQSCPTLCDPTDYTVHGILQARILEWVAFPFSRESSQPRDQTQVFCIAG